MVITIKGIDASTVSYRYDEERNLALASFLCPCKELVKHRINKHSNLRGANPLQAQTVRLINSLKSSPETFLYKCGAITLTAQTVSAIYQKDDDTKAIIDLAYPEDMDDPMNQLTFGIIDGGHRIVAMEFLNHLDALPEEAMVRVEIIAGSGVTHDFVQELVIARNSTMSISRNDMFNKQGKYQIIRELTDDMVFAGDIAYCTGNSEQHMDPQVLCAIITSFSGHAHNYHPVLHTVTETLRNVVSDFHSPGNRAVPWVCNNEELIRNNKEFFQEAILWAGTMDDIVTEFATKHVSQRLDIARRKRYPRVKVNDANWEPSKRVSTPKLDCLLAGISQLTSFDESTGKYSFLPYFKEFMTKKRILDYIKKFVTSSEIFPDKNFKKDTALYPGEEFRTNPKYFREACRIMRDEYQAFVVQKEVEAAKKKAA